jgi:predicted alpha/beta superfamily hydrolase
MVVGIESNDISGIKRMEEYSIFKPSLKAINILTSRDEESSEEINQFQIKGIKYLDDLVETVIPFIENNYNVISNRNNRILLGSSMGGIISLAGLFKHNNYFATAICLSNAW